MTQNVSRSRPSEGADPIVSVRDLRKEYGSGESIVTAVDGVSFDVDAGTVVGLLGHNGAGKTTTIKMMLGLIEPTAGSVSIAGIDVHRQSKQAFKHVGAVLEGARNIYWRLTVRENLDFFARLSGLNPAEQRERHDRLLEQLGIADRADTIVNELSRGMKQKVSLASVLAREPDVVFLDEPTLGLDVGSSLELRDELGRLVEREEMTVLVSSHDMDVIEDICDRVIILDDGQIVADDSVANLVDLFRSQDVEITVDGDIPAGVESAIRDRSPDVSWSKIRSRTRIEVPMRDGNELHDIFGLLVDAGIPIADIQTTQIDFEEVYLNITEDEDESTVSSAGEIDA